MFNMLIDSANIEHTPSWAICI